ncbi:MAG TPA: DMT family transporter [Dehalococcoidia bacterium]
MAAGERALRRPRPLLGLPGAVTMIALVAVLCLFWGVTYTIVKAALHDASPLMLAVAARAVGVLPAMAFALALGGPFPRDWRFHRFAFMLGLFNVAGLSGLINLGSEHVSSGEASLIVYAQPLLMVLAARLWLGERGGRARTIGLLLGFAGLVVVLGDRIHPGAHPQWLAYAELFGAAVCWTAGTLVFKRTPAGTPLIWLTMLQYVYGVLPLIPLMPFAETVRLNLTPHLAALVVLLGAVIGPLGWLIWLYLLERGEASVVSGNVFFVPLVALLSGVVFLGEALHPLIGAGAVLIALGIALVNHSAARASVALPAVDPA